MGDLGWALLGKFPGNTIEHCLARSAGLHPGIPERGAEVLVVDHFLPKNQEMGFTQASELKSLSRRYQQNLVGSLLFLFAPSQRERER